MLYPLLRDMKITTKVKTLIYITVLRTILTYGHESWALVSKTRIQMQAAEMRALSPWCNYVALID